MDLGPYAWYSFFKVGKQLAEINFPVHVIPFLLFKLKKIRSLGASFLLKNLLIGWIRSVMFMTCFINAARVFQ